MPKINSQHKYALAVSGGVDSMVMLHRFATIFECSNLFVVTVNHGIREQAAADCRFVADYCKELGVECRVVNVDVPAYCAEHKVSIETGARILRYQVFDSLDCDSVCLAHNADDNAETVLLHILRGSGAKGASGISQTNGKYFRPMLQWTREQIVQYATEHNVPHVDDHTNEDVKYARNFIRHKVMPLLEEVNPSAKQNILRFAATIQADDGYLDVLADASAVQYGQDRAKIPVDLLVCPNPIAYRVLFKVFQRLDVFCDIEKTHYDAILHLLSAGSGKSVNLPHGLVATNDYDYVTIWRNVENAAENGDKNEQNFEIPFAVGKIETPLGVVEVSNEPIQDSLRFDVDKLPQNCVFRTKRQGDVFTKFGGGTKPLRKYLIDKKIPQRQRDSLLLLAHGSEILVICGVEIADTVKVDDGCASHYIRLK